MAIKVIENRVKYIASNVKIAKLSWSMILTILNRIQFNVRVVEL